jgi:hypothetical protein
MLATFLVQVVLPMLHTLLAKYFPTRLPKEAPVSQGMGKAQGQ